jgi:hypothetical protein
LQNIGHVEWLQAGFGQRKKIMRRRTSAFAASVVFAVLTGMAAQSGPEAGPARVASVPQDDQPLAQARPARIAPVTMPEGNGAPVITDGIFTPGEWDDALRIAVTETVTLHLKHFRDVVFIGVRGRAPTAIGPSELSVAIPDGPVQKLHVSAQLGEIVMPASGPEPRYRFGLTTGWYANELRRDMEEGARLGKEGKSPIEIMLATTYPSDGIEFAIRRSKFPGQRWLVRLWVTGATDGKPGAIAYPPATIERTTDGWLELRFPK